MGILDFIYGLLVLIVILFLGTGVIAMVWDSKKPKEQENEELKEKMKRLRKNGGKK